MFRIARNAIWEFQAWRLERKLFREFPEFRERVQKRRKAIQSHGRITAIDKAQRAAMTALLRQSVR